MQPCSPLPPLASLATGVCSLRSQCSHAARDPLRCVRMGTLRPSTTPRVSMRLVCKKAMRSV